MIARTLAAYAVALLIALAVRPAFAAARAESTAVTWLGLVENNFPTYPEHREFLRSWHRLNFPWAYAHEDTIPIPENLLLIIDVYVTGDPGETARGGIPIPDEMNLEATVAEARIGGLAGQARVQATYADGTARWVLVALPPGTPRGWARLELWAGLSSMSAPTKVSSGGSVQVETWTEAYPWGGRTTWRAWTNTTPTGTIQGGAQPSCRQFGTPEDRTANVDGTSIVLRAGEQVAKVDGPGRAVWCSTSWYRDCADEAFLGPIAVLGQSGDRGAFVDLCLAGISERVRTEGLDLSLEPLRDLGDLSADHEGPLEAKTKWRNNEYGIVDGFFRCFAAMVGEPGSEPDGRTRGTFDAAVLAARHWSTVDVYHCEAGPLRWMWGAPWQHCGHGNSGTGDPHRGASPNTGHWNSDGVPIVRYLAGDPVMDEACDLVQRSARWKVENGPGMPGIPDYTGEERAPANLLRIVLEGRLDQPADSAAYRSAAEIVVEQGAHARPYLNGAASKVKPWLAALLMDQLEAADRQGIALAGETAALMRERMAAQWILDPGGPNARLVYQRDPEEPSNPWTGAWGLLAADCLRDSHPALAARLYECASRDPWYAGDRTEWPKTLVAQQVITFGHRFAATR